MSPPSPVAHPYMLYRTGDPPPVYNWDVSSLSGEEKFVLRGVFFAVYRVSPAFPAGAHLPLAPQGRRPGRDGSAAPLGGSRLE